MRVHCQPVIYELMLEHLHAATPQAANDILATVAEYVVELSGCTVHPMPILFG